MNLLSWSYLSLLVASFFGLMLFFGFTFRIKVHYPFSLVTLHLSSVILTFLLFTAALAQDIFGGHTSRGFQLDYTIFVYIVFLITLGTGLFFFLRYDLRKKILHLPLVSTHLVMAGLTFILLTAFMALPIHQQVLQKKVSIGSTSPAWYTYNRHKVMKGIQNNIKNGN